MRRLLLRVAKHHHPHIGVVIGAILCLASASFSATRLDIHTFLSVDLLVCTLIGVGGILLMPSLQSVFGDRSHTGLASVNPAGLACVLAAGFLGSPAVIIVALASAIAIWSTRERVKLMWSTQLAGLFVPYTVAAEIMGLISTTSGTFLTWTVGIITVIVVGEVLNWVILFPLFALIQGEVRIPTMNLPTYQPVLLLSGLSLSIAVIYHETTVVMAAITAMLGLAALYFAERAIRNHENFLGMRSLSWGVTTTALNFMSKLDDRTYRHSLNTARYTRDALQRWGFPKAVQDLGYMAGLLHQAGLAGVAKRLRIAEEEFTRDDIPPTPLEGEKTFNWNDLRTTDPDDEMQTIIEEAKRAAGEENPEELTDTIDDSSGVEPAWWRPQEGKCFLSAQDIMTLDLYPTQTALLLEGASLYGGLPDILAQYKTHHGEQTYLHQNPQIACAIANILKIAVTYETLTAVDGSFVQKPAEEALTILHERKEEFDADALNIFTTMMNEQSPNYRNGTDLAYEHPQEELMKLFASETPGPLNRKGWKRHGNILQKHPDHEKEFAIQFANDYLSHTTRNNKQKDIEL